MAWLLHRTTRGRTPVGWRRRAIRIGSAVVLPPERSEGQAEDRDLIVAVHEDRAAGVIHLVALGQIHMPERLDELPHPSGMRLDACATQEAIEVQQVVEKAGHWRAEG